MNYHPIAKISSAAKTLRRYKCIHFFANRSIPIEFFPTPPTRPPILESTKADTKKRPPQEPFDIKGSFNTSIDPPLYRVVD